jgi:NAD(P)-dependent dehydrogenase (short-subunit alcohol dehydrogenase family)
LRYALPELRKTSGIVTAATSAAGDAPLFSGWGFYGVSKAAVSFMIRQLQLEEPGITAVGISPGLCDTKMIGLLLDGSRSYITSPELSPSYTSCILTDYTHLVEEGWTPEDTAKYRKFVSSVETITPTIAGNAYAQTVTKGDKSLAGLIVEYNDPRLPIADQLKRSNVAVEYTKYSNDARAD